MPRSKLDWQIPWPALAVGVLLSVRSGVAVVIIAVIAVSCKAPETDYRLLDRYPDVEAAESELLLASIQALPYDSIELRRLPCHAALQEEPDCIAYSVKIRRNGTVYYEGSDTALLKGRRNGTAERGILTFARLCQFIDQRRLIERSAEFPSSFASHDGDYELRIWRNGDSEAWHDAGQWPQGPGDAYVFRLALDGLIATTDWSEPIAE